MNARQFVSQFEKLVKQGQSMAAGKMPSGARPKIPTNAPNVLIFSPHPDDECITGGLALRLLREAKWNVVNVGVTLGSNRARQAARRRELQNACASLGFELLVPGERGLERINSESRAKNPAHWRTAVETIAGILAAQKPRAIFIPQGNDVHPAHIGVHRLVLDALKTLPRGFACFVVETEFWGQMAEPNLLVEIGAKSSRRIALPAWLARLKRKAERIRNAR